MASARGHWWDGLAHERLARAAAALLMIRVLVGLGAWVVFNHFFLLSETAARLVPAAFVVYFIGNLLVVLRYRAGRPPPRVLLTDVVLNVLPLAVAVAAAGGLASPLLVAYALHAVIYATAFTWRIAGLYAATVVGVLLALGAAQEAGLLAIVPLGALEPSAVEQVVQIAFGALFIGAPLTVALLRRVAPPAPLPALPRRGHSEPDGTSVAVANALLGVSEVVSRLTRLDDILEQVVAIAPKSLGVETCGIALWAEDTGTYTGAVATGSDATLDQRFVGLAMSPAQAPEFEWVRRLGHCAVLPGPEPADGTEAPIVLIAPLLSGERFYGILQFSRRHRSFTQRDFAIADGIARQTAVALERARLVEESRRLVRALESTGEAVLITDAPRRVIFVNPAFLHTFGYRADEVLGHNVLELAGGATRWAAELGVDAERHGWRGETVAYRKDGTAIPILLNLSPIRDADGRVQGGVAILEDITAEKTFQAQMQRADRLAAVGEMAAGIAHEVNNALAAIFGQTECRNATDAGTLREALGRVDGQARRIAEIVQGVLEFARPRPPRPVPVDLALVTTRTLELLERDVRRQGVTIETAYEPDLPPALADAQQIQQVLLNLLGNALQAMPGDVGGRVRVAVGGADDRLAVRVTDDGSGIPAELLPRIFDPFFSTKPHGTGLGLSVSYAIARAHGGDLQVASEPGHGTTFTLLLPIATSREETVLQHVLLVDDDPEVAESLADMLAREGLEVRCAASGAEALDLVATSAWDAVFLDVRLPDLAGPEVFAQIERTRPDLAARVVFVTGGLWRSESRLRQQLPASRVLAKPCTQEQLREVLRELRAQSRQAA